MRQAKIHKEVKPCLSNFTLDVLLDLLQADIDDEWIAGHAEGAGPALGILVLLCEGVDAGSALSAESRISFDGWCVGEEGGEEVAQWHDSFVCCVAG